MRTASCQDTPNVKEQDLNLYSECRVIHDCPDLILRHPLRFSARESFFSSPTMIGVQNVDSIFMHARHAPAGYRARQIERSRREGTVSVFTKPLDWAEVRKDRTRTADRRRDVWLNREGKGMCPAG
jgi:hypothetical protein